MSVRIVFGCDACDAELAVLVDSLALGARHALEGLRLAGWVSRVDAHQAVARHFCAAHAPRPRLRLVVKAHPSLAKASPRRAG
ncbi:MAG TPA: hypothetical protein VE987_12930 [Polyangiaceae bacterium]|nr:hypothetical protein [Polyangiaceae bacterium]